MKILRVEYDEDRNFNLVVGAYHEPDGQHRFDRTFVELARVPIRGMEIRQTIEKHEDVEDERVTHDVVVDSLAIVQIDMKKLEIMQVEGLRDG